LNPDAPFLLLISKFFLYFFLLLPIVPTSFPFLRFFTVSLFFSLPFSPK
jgi:hypothetical protein